MLYFLFAFAFFSCNQEEPCSVFKLDEPVEIPLHETITHCTELISISFLDITQDSRCPENVVCVWQGLVEVEILFEVQGKEENIKLSSYPQFEEVPNSVNFNGYSIKLVDVTPYPNTTKKYREEDYRLAVQVEKTVD